MLDRDEIPPVIHEPFSAIVKEGELKTIELNITDNETDKEDFRYYFEGYDRNLFYVDEDGVITFKEAPDYENPADSMKIYLSI